jgi:hypothetical protein
MKGFQAKALKVRKKNQTVSLSSGCFSTIISLEKAKKRRHHFPVCAFATANQRQEVLRLGMFA